MTKMKTRKSVKKRFSATANGKIKRFSSGRRHILTKKSSKRKKNLAKSKLVDPGQVKMFLMLMGADRPSRPASDRKRAKLYAFHECTEACASE